METYILIIIKVYKQNPNTGKHNVNNNINNYNLILNLTIYIYY